MTQYKPDPVQILRDAIAVLETVGHSTRFLHDARTGRLCLAGALAYGSGQISLSGLTFPSHLDKFRPYRYIFLGEAESGTVAAARFVRDEVVAQAEQDGVMGDWALRRYPPGTIAHWNDNYCDGPESAMLILKRALGKAEAASASVV